MWQDSGDNSVTFVVVVPLVVVVAIVVVVVVVVSAAVSVVLVDASPIVSVVLFDASFGGEEGNKSLETLAFVLSLKRDRIKITSSLSVLRSSADSITELSSRSVRKTTRVSTILSLRSG